MTDFMMRGLKPGPASFTTIRIRKATAEKIRDKRKYGRETYDEIINRVFQ